MTAATDRTISQQLAAAGLSVVDTVELTRLRAIEKAAKLWDRRLMSLAYMQAHPEESHPIELDEMEERLDDAALKLHLAVETTPSAALEARP